MTIAALLLPFALLQAEAAPDTIMGPARFQQCVAAIDADATAAYEEAMAWAADGNSMYAYRCAAMAMVGQSRYAEGARRFESLATALGSHGDALRAELFSQAGNAWLLDRDPGRARSALTRAITLMQGDRTFMPDLLIDRARAYAQEGDYRHAEEDLSTALDMRANDALALRLRASARMHQNSFDLALADAEAAVAVDPTDVDSLLMRGHAIEARRTGTPIEEQ
ncbi:TPR repeat [alpha proteobacterium U9-1i]|nr:TPR repeat [alpha proteobacterium U9-1i]